MQNYKRIAEIMATTPEGLDKIKKILEDKDISIVDEGMRLLIIEKEDN